MRRFPANRRWFQVATFGVLAVAPKCLACGLAYAGLFSLGVELCGETPASWSGWVPAAAGAVAAIAFLMLTRGSRSTAISP